MPKENQAEIFIRFLMEELEAYRMIKKFDLSRMSKIQARAFRQLRRPHTMSSPNPTEPLDCLQLMSTTQERHFDQRSGTH